MIDSAQLKAAKPAPPAGHDAPAKPSSGPQRDDSPDDGQPFDPDATHNDLPAARRSEREARA
jgi:hypothetical protein